MSLQGPGYSSAYSQDLHHQGAGMTTRLTHRDYPNRVDYPSQSSYPSSSGTPAATSSVSPSYSRSASGLYQSPASSGVMESPFQHPQTAWTPPFRSSPSRSSQSPLGDVAPHYEYLGSGGPDYVALSAMLSSAGETIQIIPGRGKVVKRRVSANKKERRRTHSINSAFSALRGCIPNVPSDTKLSKIKTLRLATSYIAYLMDILSKDDPIAQRQLHEAGFKADISRKIESREERRRRETEVSYIIFALLFRGFYPLPKIWAQNWAHSPRPPNAFLGRFELKSRHSGGTIFNDFPEK